mgnify:CR=1 FL=1
MPAYTSKSLAQSKAYAVLDHNTKTLTITLDGVTMAPLSFTEYDEWMSLEAGVEEWSLDVHLHFDETMSVTLYGVTQEEAEGDLKTDTDTNLFVEVTEIGDWPLELLQSIKQKRI